MADERRDAGTSLAELAAQDGVLAVEIVDLGGLPCDQSTKFVGLSSGRQDSVAVVSFWFLGRRRAGDADGLQVVVGVIYKLVVWGEQ